MFHGTVTRIVGEADLQRNTLQAKVRIKDPDIRLRPDMLCRAEFLASAEFANEAGSPVSTNRSNRLVIYLPESALFSQDGNSAKAWAVDASGEHLEERTLSLQGQSRDGYIAAAEGLRPGDRVVIDPSPDLTAGERIKALDASTSTSVSSGS